MNLSPIHERLRSQLILQGHSGEQATGLAAKILQNRGHLYPGTMKATPEGVKRGNMTPEQRAIDRIVTRSNGKHSEEDYEYDYETNRAVLKK